MIKKSTDDINVILKDDVTLSLSKSDSSQEPESPFDKLRVTSMLLVLLSISSIIALTSAYISQYIFNLQPCILCLYQRKPFFVIIALTSLALFFLKSEKIKKITIYLCALLLLINAAIAIYHVGVEKKIFQGPTTCSSENLNDIDNLEDLKEALSKTKAIRCDEPSFVFLGLSMAGWNIIYCLGLFSFVIFLQRKDKK